MAWATPRAGHGRPHHARRLVGRRPRHGLGVGVRPARWRRRRSGSRSARRSACQAPPRPDWTRARRALPGSGPHRGGVEGGPPLPARDPGRGTPQLGPSVSVKIETLQPTGSFKVRGGLAAVSATLEDDPGRDVVASSAGNHGLGLAYAAVQARRPGDRGRAHRGLGGQGLGAPAVRRPAGAPRRGLPRGRDACAGAGRRRRGAATSRPTTTPTSSPASPRSPASCSSRCRTSGPWSSPAAAAACSSGVILGLEGSGVRVVGIESEASPSMSTALAAGGIVPINVEPTVADGLAGNLEPGAVTVDVALPARRRGPHRERGRHPLRHGLRRPPRWASCSRAPVPSASPRCGPGWSRPDADGKETVVILTGRNVAPKLLSEVLHS